MQDLHKELKKNVLQLQARCRSGKSNKSIANNFAGNNVHEDAQTRTKYMVPCQKSRALHSGIGSSKALLSGPVRARFLWRCLQLPADRYGRAPERERHLSVSRPCLGGPLPQAQHPLLRDLAAIGGAAQAEGVKDAGVEPQRAATCQS